MTAVWEDVTLKGYFISVSYTHLAMGLQVIIKAPILAVWAILKILGKSWQWTVVTGGAVVVLMCIVLVAVISVSYTHLNGRQNFVRRTMFRSWSYKTQAGN